jgi:hypothetical protein
MPNRPKVKRQKNGLEGIGHTLPSDLQLTWAFPLSAITVAKAKGAIGVRAMHEGGEQSSFHRILERRCQEPLRK